MAWNQGEQAQPGAPGYALDWAIAAMIEVTDRLPGIASLDRPRAFALISEAVWWVTIVDANLVRYHPEVYDRVLAEQPPADQLLVEETLAGIRYVRNQMGNDVDRADFILPAADGAGAGLSREWTWTQLPEPGGAELSPRSLDWELDRYRAYRSRLAGRPVEATFCRAASFLKAAARGADAVSAAE